MSSEEQNKIDGTSLPSDGLLSAGRNGAASDPGTSGRRLVLRGLLGGTVTLAAMRPVKTFAAKKKYCQYSGWASFKKASNTSATPKEKCTAGHKVSHYKSGGWPSSIKNYAGQSVTLHQNGPSATRFNQLFGGSDTTTLQSYLGQSVNQTQFITALFNAQLVSGFPYTVSQIYAIWTTPTTLGTGVTLSQAALYFQQLNINA